MLKAKFQEFKLKAKIFEEHLNMEMLQNEKLRITIITIAAGLGMLFFSGIIIFFGKEYRNFVKTQSDKFTVYIYLTTGTLLLYELGIRVLLNRSIRKKSHWPVIPKYANAFIETSIPTVLLYLSSLVQGPVQSLSSPPVFLYFVFIGLSALRLDHRLSIFTGTVAAVEYWYFYYFLASPLADLTVNKVLVSPFVHAEKSVIFFLFGIIIAIVSVTIRKILYRSFQTLEERNNVINIFGQHVSPSVVDKLLHQKAELPSEVRHVCIMFLDIRNFTAFSEQKNPDEVFQYLNYLFDFMIDIINHHGGIINKFLGDGFMAVFGAPFSNGNDTRNAVLAGREILDRVKKEVMSSKISETRIGIGLHCGEAVTGNVGSSKRKEYTIIGDVVNLASRIEQLNKQFNSEMLVSQAVYDSMDNAESGISFEFIAETKVKGRTEPVKLYIVL